MPSLEDKRHDFLWIVQTLMLNDTSVVGWSGHVGDAVAASYRIPAHVTARDAALDFWGFFSENFNGGGERECPYWMAQLKNPAYAKA